MSTMKYHLYIIALLLITSINLKAQQLSLDDALTLAQANNPELKASQLEIEKANQQRVIARSLFLPTISANAQLNHFLQLPPFFGFGDRPENGKIPYARFGGEDQLAAAVSAYQPLYSPVSYPTLKLSSIKQQQSAAAAKSKQVEILSQIKTNYLQVVILEERIKLAKESINRNKRALQDSKSLFLQGKGLRVDTLRAYTSVKNLEPDLVKLTYAVETAKLRLKSLIGLDSLTGLELSDSLRVPPPGVLENEQTIYDEVLSNSPDYQVLKLQELNDRQQTKIAAAHRLPVLGLVAQYQVQSQTDNFEYGNAYYPSASFVGLQLSVPIFTGLITNARTKQASLSKQQTTLQLQNRQSQLRAQVHESIANINEASLRLENTAIVQETAQLSYNIIQYRYKNGIASRIELTDAELALSTAQSNYLEAVYDYIAARIALNKLRGRVE
jgi:outer membrane protein TolC